VERELRSTFARADHEYWYSASLTDDFAAMFPVMQAFGPAEYENLLCVRSVDSIEVEWAEHFLTKRKADMDVAINDSIRAAAIADEEVANARAFTQAIGQTQVQRLEANVRLELYQQFQTYAELVGKPAEYFTDPQAYQNLMAQRHELALRLTEPHNQSLLHMHPEMLSVFSDHLRSAGPPAPVAASVSTVRQTPVQLPAASESLSPVMEFSSNARLRKRWRSERPGDDVLGIAAAQRPTSAAVVTVLRGQTPMQSEIADLEASFAEFLGVERVSVACVSIADALPAFISGLVAAVAPRFASKVSVDAKVEQSFDGERLVITLSSSSQAGADLRDELTKPEPPVLAAIEALLSFDETRVETVFN
jgi:hypothetical protein